MRTIFMIDRKLVLDAERTGALLCAAGVLLALFPSLLAAALGVELVAAAFWWWARAADDAERQVPRWEWLRRPAAALWLAVAIHAVVPDLDHGLAMVGDRGPEWLHALEAIAVVWACLELLAALPLARPYSDLSGPLLTIRPWLPILLPAVGFLVLWTQAFHWIGVAWVRSVAQPLLLLTAILGALRAFARRQWAASLRWLTVSDCAIGGLLVSTDLLPPPVSLLLWFAAMGAHGTLLAGEMRGALPRRGIHSVRLWRVAGFLAPAALSWPLLVAAASRSGALALVSYLAAAVPVALGAWVVVGRLVEAPERRRLVRPGVSHGLIRWLALVLIGMGLVGVVSAWLGGFRPSLLTAIAAALPALVAGGYAALARHLRPLPALEVLKRAGEVAPALAGSAYRVAVGAERWMVGAMLRAMRAATAPFHDLHTGDAQEYLLFLIGLGVLALLLPILQ